MSMKGSTLMQESTKVAGVFGNQRDIKVRFKGDTAMTNGKEIILPMVDEHKEFSEEATAVTRGYLDHEAAHIKHTEMACMKECVDDKERGCLNFLEDARIERLSAEEYQGAASNLATLNDVIGAESIENLKGMSAKDIGDSGLHAAIFNEHHKRLGIGTEGCQKYLDALPPEIVEAAQPWVDELLVADSTRSVLEIARRLLKSQAEEEEEEEQEQEQEEGEEGEEQEGDQEEQEGESQPEEGEGDEGQSEGEDTGSQGESQGGEGEEGTEDGEGSEGSSGQGEGKGEGKLELSRDPSKALGNVLGESDTDLPTWRRYTDEWDIDFDIKTTSSSLDVAQKGWRYYGSSLPTRLRVMKEGNLRRYNKNLKDMRTDVGKIKRILENKLLAKQDSRWEGGQKKGRFDAKRCVAAYQREKNVFSLRQEDDTLDTVVTLLVDHSGSMGSRISTARKATICLAEVLSKVQIPFRVVGFDQPAHAKDERNEEFWSDSSQREKFLETYTDFAPVFHQVYKSFDQSLNRCKAAIGAIGQETLGSHNADSISILREWSILRLRHEKKKVLIVLSDGSPCTDWASESTANQSYTDRYRKLNAATKAAVDRVVKEGGVVSAIGINDDSVRQFYDDHIVIHDVTELPKESINMLSRNIFGGV